MSTTEEMRKLANLLTEGDNPEVLDRAAQEFFSEDVVRNLIGVLQRNRDVSFSAEPNHPHKFLIIDHGNDFKYIVEIKKILPI